MTRERSRADVMIPAGIFLAAFLLHWLQGRAIATPWLLPEELDAARAARSFVGVGHGGGGGTLYPVVTSPLWSGSVATGYALAKLVGALLVAAVAFPTYALARRHAGAGWAAAAALLAAGAPATVTASAVTPLPLAYLLSATGLAVLEPVVATRRIRHGVAGLVALGLAAASWPPALWLVVPALVLAALALAGRSVLRWPGAAALIVAPAVAYAVFHVARTYSTGFASGTDDAAHSLLDAVEFLGSFAIGISLLPAIALARGPARSAYAVAFLLVPLAIGAGVLDDPYLLVLGLPPLAVAAGWSVDCGSSRRLVVVAAVVAVAALGSAGRGTWAALAALLGLTRPELSILIVLGSGLVLISLWLAAGADRWRGLALPALAGVALVATIAGEVAAARDVRGDAGPPEVLPTRASVGLLAAATTQPRTLDELLFWNPDASIVHVEEHEIDPATGTFAPPLPPHAAYLDLAGAGLDGSFMGTVAGAPLVRLASGPTVVATTEGVYPDSWTGAHAVYRRFGGAARAEIVLSLSRAGWKGPTPPDPVKVSAGPLDGKPALERTVVVAAGKTVHLNFAAPPIPFRLDVYSQTFTTAEYGGTDRRPLGVQLNVAYRAR